MHHKKSVGIEPFCGKPVAILPKILSPGRFEPLVRQAKTAAIHQVGPNNILVQKRFRSSGCPVAPKAVPDLSVGVELVRGVEAILDRAVNADRSTLSEVVERAQRLTDAFNLKAIESELEYSQQAFHRLLYQGCGIEFDESAETLERAYWDAAFRFEPEPGVHAVLSELSHRAVPMGIISNICFSGAIVHRELEKHGLARYFQFVVASADYGVRKPNRELFDLGVYKLGGENHTSCYTGNMVPYDIVGAANAGLLPVWYNRYGHDAPLPEGTVVIRHWDEFLTSLEIVPPRVR